MGGPLGGAAGHYDTSRAGTVALLRTPLRRLAAVALLIVAVVLPHLLSVQNVRIAVAVGVAMMGAAGLNVVVGRAGQMSLAASAFLAVGAFGVVIASDRLSMPFVPAVVCATLLGGLLGAILALPALRLRGLYLILATLGFYWVVWYLASEYEGSRGLTALTGLILSPPTVAGLTFDSPLRWYYLLLAANVGVVVVLANLRRTKFDRAWVALRDREVMARALGVSPATYKVAAFVLSSAILSLAGAIGAYTIGSVSSAYYSLDLGIEYLAMIVIGGLGSVLGAYLGATFVILVPHLITSLFDAFHASAQVQSQYLPPVQSGIFGVLMVCFLIFEPQGLAGIWARVRHYFEMWPLRHTRSEVAQ
jgi:branched-chain amino acid transport system permease protein